MPQSSAAAQSLFIVTGANAGLGFETAKDLAARSGNNTVILACRDVAKGAEAQRVIATATGNTRVRAMQLDLSSLASVREFAATFRAEFSEPIDALICNAGISRGPAQTEDGIDGVFETNHLGHFLLTELLLDKVSSKGRVISVSSDMHQPPGPKLRWPGAAALATPRSRRVSAGLRYSYSKLCNLYFVYELARRLAASGSGVAVAAFNPGLMTDTNFASVPGPVGAVMKRIFASRVGDLGKSSAALSELAADQGDAPIAGLYFDRTAAAPTRSSEISYNVDNARDLWEVSSRLTASSAV
jgi:NAD(P)-dependent dehydrogenase (short-subunit alcohol dehydrogenase family)